MRVAIGSFAYSYPDFYLPDGMSLLVKACAVVNELFDLFQGGSNVYCIGARCVSADAHDLRLIGIQWWGKAFTYFYLPT